LTLPALYPLLLFVVGEKQKACRIDAFLAGQHKNYSRSKLKSLCDAGRLLVNNHAVKASYIVKPNDSIALLTPYANQGDKLAPKNIPIEILFEDEHLIVVNKSAGIAVHPGLGDYNNTLVNALNFHLNTNSNGAENKQILVVHRLDKHTSGAIVFAKTQKALEHLSQQFANHSTERIYFALVCGIPVQKKGRIETYMGRHPNNEKDIRVSEDKKFGKNAITNFEVVQEFRQQAALVKCTLETGRTHQIRIHMQYLGHALINDNRYPDLVGNLSDGLKEACFQIQPFQALHAQCLGFQHPETQEALFFECHFPTPYLKLLAFLEPAIVKESSL
jgi:23S rRNA pseudouridine1911/1915/1917 synthase